MAMTMDPIRLTTTTGLALLLAAAPAAAQDRPQPQQGSQERPPQVREAAPDVQNQLVADQLFLRMARSASLRDANVRVAVNGDTATLEGTVPSESARRRAAAIANQHPRIADVENRLTVAQRQGTQGQARSGAQQEPPDDGAIAERVANRLAGQFPEASAEERWLFGWNVQTGDDWEVDVSVDDGDVTLGGNVPSMQHVRQVVETARQVPGVRSVRSELAFERQTGASGQAGRSGAGASVSREDLEKYADAITRMSEGQPEVREAIREGRPVVEVLNQVPTEESERAIEQAGLSDERFRRITEQLVDDQSLQQRFGRVVREEETQSGGGAAGGQSGAQSPTASESPSGYK